MRAGRGHEDNAASTECCRLKEGTAGAPNLTLARIKSKFFEVYLPDSTMSRLQNTHREIANCSSDGGRTARAGN